MSFYCGVSLRWLSFSSCPTIMVAVRCGKRFATKRTDCHQGERVLLFQLEVCDEEKELRACLQLRPRWLSPGEAAAAPPGWSAHSLLRTAASWPLRYCVLDTATAAKRQPQKSPEKPLGSLFQASQSVDSCLETSLWLIAKLPSRLSCCQPLVWPPPSPSFHRPGSLAPKQACSRLLSLWLLVFKCLALTEICSLASSIFLGIVIFLLGKRKACWCFYTSDIAKITLCESMLFRTGCHDLVNLKFVLVLLSGLSIDHLRIAAFGDWQLLNQDILT